MTLPVGTTKVLSIATCGNVGELPPPGEAAATGAGGASAGAGESFGVTTFEFCTV